MLKIRCKQEVQKHVVWGIRQLMWSWAVISTPMPEKSPASLSLNYIWKKEGWFRKVKDQFMKYKTSCLLCGTKYIPSNEDCLCTNRTGCNFRWLDTLPGTAGSLLCAGFQRQFELKAHQIISLGGAQLQAGEQY